MSDLIKPKIISAFAATILLVFLCNIVANVYIALSGDYIFDKFSIGFVIVMSVVMSFLSFKLIVLRDETKAIQYHSSILGIISIIFIGQIIIYKIYDVSFGFNTLPFIIVCVVFFLFPSFREFSKKNIVNNHP